MEDSFVCPACHEENAYFDGVCYVCPDCPHEWDSPEVIDSYEEENVFKSSYQGLSKFDEPFFKLAVGQLYSCLTEDEEGEEKVQFVALAIEESRNRFFVWFHPQSTRHEDLDYFKQALTKDFSSLKKDVDSDAYFSHYAGQLYMCATDKDGTFLCERGMLCKDINEVV